MPRVRCLQRRCVFWEDDYCTAEEIELDPEQLSCLTMEELEDEVADDESWDDEDLLDDEEEWLDEDEDEEDAEEEDEWSDREEDKSHGFKARGKDEW